MDAAAALAVTGHLAAAGIRHWIVGGWGVDALTGSQAREHHDLDLFVEADAVGTIAGDAVPCATAEAQLVLHSGYELPAAQQQDVERLRSLLRAEVPR